MSHTQLLCSFQKDKDLKLEIETTCNHCPFVDNKLKQLLKEELITSLQHVIPSTLVTHVGVHVQQIQPQSNLVINPTLVNQHLSWQQLVTPLIVRQPRAIPHPPYPMWYNTIPPFDPNMYSMYYYGIKRLDPLIFRKKERYAVGIT
jgi:hypothetical protein